MSAIWVTVEVFSRQTGIREDEANKKCRSDEWPEGVAWVYYSEKKRLINLEWWNRKWDEAARVIVKQRKLTSKLNAHSSIITAASASSSIQLRQILEK
jgi:hypothetical protein